MTAPDATERAATIAMIGHDPAADPADAITATADASSLVRVAAFGALARRGRLTADLWARGTADEAAPVRARAAELAVSVVDRIEPTTEAAVRMQLAFLLDDELQVVEAAAWALGECGESLVGDPAVLALIRVATEHADPLAREVAVAALGAVADDRGRDAILAGCTDKPAVRRRAVLALAPFDGPEVDAALAAALEDRDWQVRQAAEDLR